MAVSDRLYELLAEAKSRPSRAYRAAKAAIDIPGQALEGYLGGTDIAEKIKERRLQEQTLADILGSNAPSGLEGTTVRQANAISKPVEAYSSLLKAKREAAIKDARAQQANFLLNGQLMEYDPDKGYYPARVGNDSSPSSSGSPSAPLNITPRVAPAIPGAEVAKTGGLLELKELTKTAAENFKPEFTGFMDAAKTRGRQFTGKGATDSATYFTRAINDMSDALLRARSGAQINEQEYRRLRKIVPSQYTSDPDFLGRLQAFDAELTNIIRTKETAFKGAGYRTPTADLSKSGIPQFSSVQDAERSGRKGIVLIGGRRAVIE